MIKDQKRDRYRTRGADPRTSTPRSSLDRGPRNTSTRTRLLGPWSPIALGTSEPTSEDAVVQRPAARSSSTARESQGTGRSDLGRRAGVATDMASPMLDAPNARPPRRPTHSPERARPRCVEARASSHHGRTAARRLTPRCLPRHALCPGDQATEKRPRVRARCHHRACARSTPGGAAKPPLSTGPRRIRGPVDGSASYGGQAWAPRDPHQATLSRKGACSCRRSTPGE